MVKRGKALLIAIPLFLIRVGPAADGVVHQSAAAIVPFPSESDEFVGPFPSWRNVQTSYGAVADGSADDTAAIQRGLDEVGRPGRSPVLFFPRGTYRVTRTLVLTSNINISIVGVGNGGGAGNCHVYNSVFRESTVSDLYMGNTGGFSARGNYSAHSKAFFASVGGTNNPATIDIQHNVVVDPIDAMAIRLGNQGPGLIVDNVIRSAPGATGPVVYWTSFLDADVASVGNTFTVARPIENNGRLRNIGDRVVARGAVSAAEPALPATLPNLKRSIFEVPSGADANRIQQAINAAALQNGYRPVVHIPDGSYSISQTLTIPATDVQLVGDGYGTILRWTGIGSGPVIRLSGPSKVALRELQIDGAARADGLWIENIDQVGSRVYMDQAQLRAATQTNLFVNGLDNTYVQLEDVGYAYSPDAVSIKVVGGPLSSAGNSTAGRTNIYSGASRGNRISYEVSS